MTRLITLTATTKVPHDDNADDVARELAEALADLPISGASAPEIRIDHYFVAEAPHYLPLRESRVLVTMEVEA